MKQRVFAFICVVLAAYIALSACSKRNEEVKPTNIPEDMEKNERQPDGWYEISENNGKVYIYLSYSQAEWKEKTNADNYTVTEEKSENEGYKCFVISQNGEQGECDIVFVGEKDGKTISECAVKLFINEAGDLSVIKCDIKEKPFNGGVAEDSPQTVYYFTLDYNKASSLLTEFAGEEAIGNARKVIAAFLSHDKSAKFKISGDVEYVGLEKLGYALDIMCPPFYALTNVDYHKMYKNGVLSWKYAQDKEKTEEALGNFKNKIENWMSNLDALDSEIAKSMILYNCLTVNGVYDYDYFNKKEVTEEELRKYAAPYTAIMKASGVCFSYARALSFLYTQAEIESVPVAGTSPTAQHEWVVAQIDGKYYYNDPTYDIGGGFKYFGMTTEDRCSEWGGSYYKDKFFICVDFEGIAERFNAEDKRFLKLHEKLSDGNAGFVYNHSKKIAVFANGTIKIDCN